MMNRKSVRSVIFIGIAILALAGAGYFLIEKAFVPDAFSEARVRSAGYAEEIVAMTDESLVNLEKISSHERENNLGEAIRLVREELARSLVIREISLDLAEELKQMTVAVIEIRPARAQELALEAVTHESYMIAHLFEYNGKLYNLFQALQLKFEGGVEVGDQAVQRLIREMNQEAEEVNRLNDLYNEKMDEFDRVIVRRLR